MSDVLDAILHSCRAAIARAVRAGDVEAERFARRQYAAGQIAEVVARSVSGGAEFSPAEIRMAEALIAELATREDPRNPIQVLHAAVSQAEAAEGTCDRCDAPEATVSGSLDLTGTQTPAVTLERLCAGCRETAR